MSLLDSIASLGNAQQLIAEAPARAARGQTVKIEWKMNDNEAPAAPSMYLNQYGNKFGTVYTNSNEEDDGEGGKRKVRTGWVFVTPKQYKWADYVLRRTQGSHTVTSKPHPANVNVQPGPLGESWGAPPARTGLGGKMDSMISGSFGYKVTRGKRGIEHMGAVSGVANRAAGRRAKSDAKGKRKPKRKRSRKRKAGRNLMREIRSLW